MRLPVIVGHPPDMSVSKKRVFDAIHHREPDQVPCDYWGTPEIDRRLMHHFSIDSLDDVRRSLKADISYMLQSTRGKGDKWSEANVLWTKIKVAF